MRDLNILDIYFSSGSSLELACVMNADEEEAIEEMDVFVADGFIHIKSKPSWAPVNVSNRFSDAAWYDHEGSLLAIKRDVSGNLFAPREYSYMIEAPSGILSNLGIKIS